MCRSRRDASGIMRSWIGVTQPRAAVNGRSNTASRRPFNDRSSSACLGSPSSGTGALVLSGSCSRSRSVGCIGGREAPGTGAWTVTNSAVSGILSGGTCRYSASGGTSSTRVLWSFAQASNHPKTTIVRRSPQVGHGVSLNGGGMSEASGSTRSTDAPFVGDGVPRRHRVHPGCALPRGVARSEATDLTDQSFDVLAGVCDELCVPFPHASRQ